MARLSTIVFKSKLLRVLLSTVTIVLIAVIEFGSGQLVKINDCTCPGDIVTYDCNVIGSGFTIWRGSAFDCPTVDSMILLRHSKFEESSGTMGQCNSGAIRGQSIGTGTNSLGNTVYTSQLMINLTASPSVIDQTIECIYRNPNAVDTLVDTTVLEITDPPHPPTNIQLVSVSPKQLVFNWTLVETNCSTLQYNVVSNCGTCLHVTDKSATSATCSIDLSTATNDVMLCYFGISSAICANANISGNLSTPLDVMLKVPPSPIISSTVPHYNQTDNKLIDLDIKFHEVASFIISNGVDGSALNYTISYTDSNTGDACYSLTISASSCVKGICTVPSISPLPCSERAGDGDIVISISASNHLGTGPSSFTTIGQTNKYFNVTLTMTNKITCTNLNQQEIQSIVTCDVVYWPCHEHRQQQPLTARGTPSTVNIDLPESPPTSNYCYAVTANNGTFTVLIEGWIKSSDQDTTLVNDCCMSLETLSIVFSIMIVIVLIVVTVTVTTLICWNYKRKKREFMPVKGNTNVTMSYITKVSDHKSRTLVERYGDTVLISIQDKPWQLMQALEIFQEIDIVDTKIIGSAENGYGKISIQCKEPPSDDKMEHIKQHIEFMAREEIKITQLQSTSHRKMTYCQSFPPKCGSLYTLLKQVKGIGSINITDINVHPTSSDPTHKDIKLTFYCESGYPENWKEEFDRVFTDIIIKHHVTS